MKNLSMMTWKEIKALNKEKSIAFVVLAPIEEHGCCLPLATDLLEGEFWSRGAMSKVEESLDAECFYLPTFPIAAASVTEFYGSIHFTMKTTYVVTLEILESLCCMDFKHIVVIASHADPQHQIAVEKAVRKVNRKYGICAISPMGPIFMGVGIEQSERIKEVQKNHANDFHAGWIETSSLMAMDKSYVRNGYDSLPDSQISDRDMIFKKKQLAAMGDYGHIGSPRLATAELGKELNENCIDSICDAVVRFYNRNGYQKYSRYFLYKILPLHLGFLSGKVKRRKEER
jgi:creatinine amidohydrolase